jgi:hypothetical protein
VPGFRPVLRPEIMGAYGSEMCLAMKGAIARPCSFDDAEYVVASIGCSNQLVLPPAREAPIIGGSLIFIWPFVASCLKSSVESVLARLLNLV